MILKMDQTNVYNQKYILALQNISGTEFDEDYYDPTNTEIPNMIIPSTTDLKLGWVLWKCNHDWTINEIYKPDQNEDQNIINQDINSSSFGKLSNLNLVLRTGGINLLVGGNFHNAFDFQIVLFPDYMPSVFQELTLEYKTNLHIALQDEGNQDIVTNPTDTYDILDVVQLVNLVMTSTYSTEYDFNNDNMMDIFDIVTLISIILEE